MIQLRRVIGILAASVVLCVGTVVLGRASGRPEAGGVVSGRVGHRETAAAATTAQPGAPPVPEESATIRDDPTIAPDPKQSADNNVSFPNDI